MAEFNAKLQSLARHFWLYDWPLHWK